jgi:hypothetical protein
MLLWSGDGYCLFGKKLDREHFVRPQASNGTAVTLSGAQLGAGRKGSGVRSGLADLSAEAYAKQRFAPAHFCSLRGVSIRGSWSR